MTDLSASHGVTHTIIKNLKGEQIFLPWFPSANGEGRWLEPYQRVKIAGNLFEAINAQPHRKAGAQLDMLSGRIAMAACGDPNTEYLQLTTPIVTLTCSTWEFESSSSAWIQE